MSGPQTYDELALMTPAQWRDWFSASLQRWYSVPEEAVRPEAEGWLVRLRAFVPVGLRPDEERPARRLAANIIEALEFEVGPAAHGLGLLLDRWKLGARGADACAFALAVGDQLQTPDLAQKALAILEREAIVNEAGREIVVPAIMAAVNRSGSPAEKLAMASALHSRGWLEPEEAAKLLPPLARRDLAELARLIAELAPELVKYPVNSSAVHRLAATMARETGWRAPRAGLLIREVAGFEQALSRVLALSGLPPPVTISPPAADLTGDILPPTAVIARNARASAGLLMEYFRRKKHLAEAANLLYRQRTQRNNSVHCPA